MKQDLLVMSIAIIISLIFYVFGINTLLALGMTVSILLSILYGYNYKGQKTALHAAIPVLLFVGWLLSTVIGGWLCTIIVIIMFLSWLYYAYYTDMRKDEDKVTSPKADSQEYKKYCPGCGTGMDISASFCPSCGKEQ